VGWTSGELEGGEPFANCRTAKRRQRDEAKVERLVYKASRRLEEETEFKSGGI
jgi:hypothetical protein